MANIKKLVEINNYWLTEFDHLEEDYPTCFVCGEEHGLELCHLIPKAKGGSNDPSNIVLLCRRCHSEAPNITIPEIMLKWIHEETSKYELLTHMKNKDLTTKIEYILTIYNRITKLFYNIQVSDVLQFIEAKVKKDVVSVPYFHEANRNTFILYYKYLSEYDKLEEDFSNYLYSK